MSSSHEHKTMGSPFPGMDPYLERHWDDLHARFLVYACDQLNEQLPAGLLARIAAVETIESDDHPTIPDDKWRTVYPDEQLTERLPDVPTRNSSRNAPVATPSLAPPSAELAAQRHLEIVETTARRVVTVVELLTPACKRRESAGAAYRARQEDYLEQGINLVEIDLLLEGAFLLAVPEERVPAGYRDPYLICLRRATGPRGAELFGVRLRKPLPEIPIPLRPHEGDAVLRLQAVIDESYRRGRYHSIIDYRAAPLPHLSDDELAWVHRLMHRRVVEPVAP